MEHADVQHLSNRFELMDSADGRDILETRCHSVRRDSSTRRL